MHLEPQILPRRRPIRWRTVVPAARHACRGRNPLRTPLSAYREHFQNDQDPKTPEQPEGQIDGHQILPLPPSAARRGAGREAFAPLSQDEYQAMIQAGMLQLSVRISRRIALLGLHQLTGPPSPGFSTPWTTSKPPLLDCRKPTTAILQDSRVRFLLLLEAWFPKSRQPAVWISAPADHAGGLPLFSSTPRAVGVCKVLITP